MDQIRPNTSISENACARSFYKVPDGDVAAARLPLFRPEAIRELGDKAYGEIILLRPVALSLLLLLAMGFIAALTAFLVLGHYTNKAHISGVLLPDQGLIKLYGPAPGTLVRCSVREGQEVRKEDVLFELSSDKSSVALGSTETEIRRELLSRRQSLAQERADNLKLSLQQETYLRDRIDKIHQEELHLAIEIDATEKKADVAERMLARYQQLQRADLISSMQFEEKEVEPLEQQKALQELKRSQVALEGELRDAESQLQRVPLQTQLQVAALDRSISEIEGQLSEHEASRAAVVRAPADGIVSAIVDKIGVTVQPSTALATLIPVQAKLEAHLYAPSRAVGFIKPGENVLLRYQAYPSEKFGHYQGVISQVSRVAISPPEYAFRTGGTADEPMYEITVPLPSQTILLYGQPRLLQAGMAVDADVTLDRRRLIEWIFEPLLSLRGRLAA